MFEWTAASLAVTEGSVSPLSIVRELAPLDDLDLLSLDADAALAVVELVQAATSSLSAISALAIEALTRREKEHLTRERDDQRRRGDRSGAPTAEDLAIGSLAPTLHLTPRTMGSHLDQVRTLVNHLPRTFALVRAGRLDLHRAGAVASEALLVSPQHRDTLDDQITTTPTRRRRVPLVDLTPGGVHQRAAALATRIDPDSAAARATAALDERFVRVRPGNDPGVTSWSASLPSDTSLQAWAAVDALATQYATTDPTRHIDQARADAFIDLVRAQATIRTTVDLVVPLDPTHTSQQTPPQTDQQAPPRGAPQAPPPQTPPTAWQHSSQTWSDDSHAHEGAGHQTCLSPWERHLHLVVVNGIQVELHTSLTGRNRTASGPPNAWSATGDTGRPPDPRDAEIDDWEDVREGDDRDEVDHDTSDLLLTEPLTDEDRDPGADPTLEQAPRVDDDRTGRSAVTLPTCEVGVRHPRVGILLNAAVTAWLADPDTRIRLHGSDPLTGAVTIHDPTTYRPNQRLARIVRARDGHCRFPGCTTDAARTQLDHVVRFPDGPTTVTNLACLCSRHHKFKHRSGWTLSMDAAGTCTWTTPYGRIHVTHARSTSELVA